MLRKHSILLGILISISLLILATIFYPGGSQLDKDSIGYDWTNNYISNLFGEKAVNGSDNTGRFWAVAGMAFLSASFALFFIEFSKKIPKKNAAQIVKFVGVSCMLFAFLIATPLHNTMVVISSIMFLICIFYITVFVFMTKLHVFKFLCVTCLLIFYTTLYIYGSEDLREFLPIMQKVTFTICILLVLGLEYFAKKEDFEHIQIDK